LKATLIAAPGPMNVVTTILLLAAVAAVGLRWDSAPCWPSSARCWQTG